MILLWARDVVITKPNQELKDGGGAWLGFWRRQHRIHLFFCGWVLPLRFSYIRHTRSSPGTVVPDSRHTSPTGATNNTYQPPSARLGCSLNSSVASPSSLDFSRDHSHSDWPFSSLSPCSNPMRGTAFSWRAVPVTPAESSTPWRSS